MVRHITRDDFMQESGIDSDPGGEHGYLKGMACMSGRARKRVEKLIDTKWRRWFRAEATYQKLVDAGEIVDPSGIYTPTPPIDKKAQLLRRAKELRTLAAGGMCKRKYPREAAKLEKEAEAIV